MLLPHLLDLLFLPRESELLLRELSDTALLPFLLPQPVHTTKPATTALLPFKEPLVRAAVHEAKYVHNKKAHILLAHVLEDFVLEQLSERSDTVLVPIPLSRERLRERGFNQCEEIVRRTSELSTRLSTKVLMRMRDTEHQTRLSGTSRNRNISEAFTANSPAPQTTYILIDDVITTGATMREAITALQRAGARHIYPIALAH